MLPFVLAVKNFNFRMPFGSQTRELRFTTLKNSAAIAASSERTQEICVSFTRGLPNTLTRRVKFTT